MTKVVEKTTDDNNCTKYTPLQAIDEFDLKHGILDSTTPKETYLSGRYKRSFAYYTFRYRLPNTLSSLLKSLQQELNVHIYSKDEIVRVLECVTKLKNQLENDAQLEKFQQNESDSDLWNNFLSSLPSGASFFKTCWIYAECYLYRKIYSFFEASTDDLRDYDYFAPQKINALQISDNAMEEVLLSIKSVNNCDTLSHMLKLNLWGNKCDLSISSGQEIKPLDNLHKQIDCLNDNILIDNSAQIWDCLNKPGASKSVDFICDNAGFELFTDLLLAQYLIENKLADEVRFHVKAMPWFVSDTTYNDIKYTLKYLEDHKSEVLNKFGRQCSKNFNENRFKLCPPLEKEYFWTTPFEFYRMQEVSPSLYAQLCSSSLIIFKGDLNYRKLLGDFNWETTNDFSSCLRGFQPSNLCALRTIKGPVICGLKSGQAEQLFLKKMDWMFTGDYAVIQFAGKNSEHSIS
ncbi:damage-control phosphatase ARMT1 [Stomoxys calcitrans]|uniref:Sugar phosphate phosphatase n=1 Tax=Stomoxys calcitrans TaxID=35570 RepID=A0A1I8P9G0_STOCA|nr:damage-control phosphatase ARMT1 [Stomoxys calcitrans]